MQQSQLVYTPLKLYLPRIVLCEATSSSSSRMKLLMHAIIALGVCVAPVYINFALVSTAIFFLSAYQAFVVFGLLSFFAVVPLNQNTKFGAKLLRYVCKYTCAYFPVTLHVEDTKVLDPNRAYVFGFEPHSVFPIGIIALLRDFGFMPVSTIKFLASSAIFYTPFLRQICAWMGLTPITKQNFISLLTSGYSCILVPGGTQETFYMEHNYEVVFLNTRKGFVRVAMETGCPLVPVFCFGQTKVYKWWKPNTRWYHGFSRAIKFTPILFWGKFGTPLPYQSPMHVVVGRPIELKKTPQPTAEEVNDIHSQFVEALRDLFERHKARAGHADLQLQII